MIKQAVTLELLKEANAKQRAYEILSKFLNFGEKAHAPNLPHSGYEVPETMERLGELLEKARPKKPNFFQRNGKELAIGTALGTAIGAVPGLFLSQTDTGRGLADGFNDAGRKLISGNPLDAAKSYSDTISNTTRSLINM